MSLAAFQSELTRLVIDERWREEVRTAGPAVLGGSLTERERRRLVRAAADPGLVVTAKLVRSFRLSKILTLFPLTRALLGDAVLGREVRRFWAEHPPRTYYVVEEALAFAASLMDRRLYNPFIDEVVGFEAALIELRRPRAAGHPAPALTVEFRHDPRVVLGALAEGLYPPRRTRPRPCTVQVSLTPEGTLEWSPTEEAA
jgi:hypothetical protein